MKYFNHSCQGESHKATGKDCQDYSLTWEDKEKGIVIAVVCDGHGGDCYFRSATGARLAAEITREQVSRFLTDVDSSLFADRPFTAVGTQDTSEATGELDDIMRRLFLSIYSRWRLAVTEDGQRALTEWEQEHVDEQYKSLLNDEQRIVKAYGCTLMAFACTKDYWLAFHLGDGKMVMLNDKHEFSQPVPWDEKCFLNKTTSLCSSEPVKDFRYCVEGDGTFPVAVFLGSDGLDDTYGDGPKLNNFYGSLVKELALKGQNAVEEMLKEDLPQISKIGSQDDMSVAVVYDEAKIADAAIGVNQYQIQVLNDEICEIQKDIQEKKTLIGKVRDLESSIERMKAEARMAEKEIERKALQIKRLRERLDKLESFTLQNKESQYYEEES